MTTPYIPNIIEVLQRNTARRVALAAPDGQVFRDVSGDLVTRKRTEQVAGPIPRRKVWPVAPAKPSQAEILSRLA